MDQYSLVAGIYIAPLISFHSFPSEIQKNDGDAEKWNVWGKITKENCVGRLRRKSLLDKLSPHPNNSGNLHFFLGLTRVE